MKLKIAYLFFYLILTGILSNSLVCLKRCTISQLSELTETEKSENAEAFKIKTDPSIDVFQQIAFKQFALTCSDAYFLIHVGFFTLHDSRPESPPPDCRVA